MASNEHVSLQRAAKCLELVNSTQDVFRKVESRVRKRVEKARSTAKSKHGVDLNVEDACQVVLTKLFTGMNFGNCCVRHELWRIIDLSCMRMCSSLVLELQANKRKPMTPIELGNSDSLESRLEQDLIDVSDIFQSFGGKLPAAYELIKSGCSNEEISSALGVSMRSAERFRGQVRYHVQRYMQG